MEQNKDNKYYLERMLDYINMIEQYIENMENNNIHMEPNNQYELSPKS